MEAGARCFRLRRSYEEQFLLFKGELLEGLLQIDLVTLGGEVDEAIEILRTGARAEGAVEQRLGPVGDDFGGVEIVDAAEAVALGTGAVGGVEGEAARLELRDVEAAVRAGHAGRIELLGGTGAPLRADQDEAVGHLQRFFYGGEEVLFDAGLEDGAIDDRFNGVVLALFESGRLSEIEDFAVDAGAEALLVELVEEVFEFAFAAADDGRVNGDAFARREGEDALDDLLGGLAGDLAAAAGAVGHADRGVEEAEVVVDFCDGADGGAGAAAGRFLLDGNGRGEAFDGVDIGPLDLVEELARVGRKGFDVAALAFGVDGVEGEGGLPGSGEAGDHGKGIPRDLDADVAQIMLAGAPHRDVSDGHVRRR